MSADIIELPHRRRPRASSRRDRRPTVGDLVDTAYDLPWGQLPEAMIAAAQAAGELSPIGAASPKGLRQLVTLGALLTRYLWDKEQGLLPHDRRTRI